MLDFAGLINKVNLVHGAADKVLPSLNSKFQFVFIDHAKKKYLPDLELIEKNSLIESQSIVFADNVGIFEDDMKSYFSHVRNSGKYKSQNIGSTLEYRNNIYDAVEISVMN
jgi:predicted O-methyltransferase YrrM